MKKDILNALVEYDYNPFKIDRLIVSSFLTLNRIDVRKNTFVKQYQIREKDTREYEFLNNILNWFKKNSQSAFTIEDLIEIFEFVISPQEKIVTGAVYTPLHIRDYIINNCIKDFHANVKVADIACGCGGFLITAAKRIKTLTGKGYIEIIENNLWGLDIANYSLERCKIVLSLLALQNGEDNDVNFNLYHGNALNFNWKEESFTIKKNNGFDVIVGNPPYVCSRNIDATSRALLGKWEVTSTGHPDLYIPFFQIALENLTEGGVLGYITVNSFFKSINGRAVRKYFSEKKFEFTLIDFKNEQVFNKRNTYTCICIIRNKKSDFISYLSLTSRRLPSVKNEAFANNFYNNLDNKNGWNLGDSCTLEIINKIEQFKTKIFPKFSFSTGIATLKNDIYKFNISDHDSAFFYFSTDEGIRKIEKRICREIINANKITIEDELNELKEKIIFPYVYNKSSRKYEVIDENDFKKEFPYAYKYLLSQREKLAERDKGNPKVETWYAFGRSQGLHVQGIKLFLPHLANDPSFVICNDRRLLFCNGEAIVSDNERELKVLKKILESKLFWFYISKTSKPYSSGYFSLGKNYLKQFSLPELTSSEKAYILDTKNKDLILKLLLKKYGLQENCLK